MKVKATCLGCLLTMLIPAAVVAADIGVAGTVPVSHPTEMALSLDGTELYVQAGGPEIIVTDTATHTVIASIPYSGGFLMDISPDGSRLYISGTGQLEVIDTANRIALSPIAIPGSAALSGVAVSPDGSRIFVSDRGTWWGTVYVIDSLSGSLTNTIQTIGNWPFTMGIDVTPDGSRAYLASRKYGVLDAIDLSTETHLGTINLNLGWSAILAQVTITPDGTRAYVSNAQYSFVSVVDIDPTSTTYHQEIDYLDTGGSGLGRVRFNSDGSRGFVTDGPWGDSRVFVLDTDPASSTYHSVLEEVAVGNRPWGVAPFDDGHTVAFVSNWGIDSPDGGSVSVLERIVVEVSIDVKPGSSPNCFNLNGHGVIPVAVLGSMDFDAADIDTSSVEFNGLQVRVRGKRGPACALQDVNADGYDDLICHFEDDPTYWVEGDTSGMLVGELFDGQRIEGTDSICLVP